MKNIEVTKNIEVKQNFQSEWQLVALEVHKYLVVGWMFVTAPVRWVIAQIDSTPTIRE